MMDCFCEITLWKANPKLNYGDTLRILFSKALSAKSKIAQDSFNSIPKVKEKPF